MKKIIGCIILLIGIVSTSQARPSDDSTLEGFKFLFGPRAGVGVSHFMLDLDANKKADYKTDLGFGWHAGVVSRIEFPYVYIQPEVLVTSSGATYRLLNTEYALHYMKLHIPIMLGVKVKELIRVQVGPTFSVLLRAKEKENDISVNYERISAGWQAGIGLDFGPFMFDLKYEGNLSKFGKKLSHAGVGVDVDHRQGLFIASVGVDLLNM